MKYMKAASASAILLAMSFSGANSIGTARADEANYGPDWPMCENLDLDPKTEVMACTRLLQSGKLTQQHTSWAYNDRGTAWLDLGKLKLALGDFSKSMEVDPTNFAPHFNMSLILYENGNLESALIEIDRAIGLKPEGGYLYTRKGKILSGLGRRDEAIVVLNRALELDPGDKAALLARQGAYFSTGQFDLALADISAVIESSPMTPELWAWRGQVYAALFQYAKAIADFDRSLQLAPDYTEAYSGRAASYFALGQYALARADCEVVISKDPTFAECVNYIARSLMLEGKTDEAIGKFTEIVQVADSPVPARDPLVLLTRGALRYSQGAYDAANEDFASSIAQDPKSPYGYLWKYLAGRCLGVDDKQALEGLNRRDIWPSPVIRYVLGEISAEDVLASTDVPDEMLKKQRTAEANFYLGELAAIGGNDAAATAYFNAAVNAGEIEISTTTPGQRIRYLYKANNDIEVGLAKTMLQGKTL